MMRAAGLALLLYAASLAFSAPAFVLAWALEAATNGVATLEGAHGSLWRGRATSLVIFDRLGGAHRYEKLNWEWLGAPWAGGEPGLRIEIDDARLRGAGRITPRMNGLRVDDATIRLPASSLAAYLPALSRTALSGEISVQLSGALRAERRGARSGGPGWSFEGIARGLPNDTAGPNELLRLLGPDLGGGAYRIRVADRG